MPHSAPYRGSGAQSRNSGPLFGGGRGGREEEGPSADGAPSGPGQRRSGIATRADSAADAPATEDDPTELQSRNPVLGVACTLKIPRAFSGHFNYCHYHPPRGSSVIFSRSEENDVITLLM